MTHSAVPQRTGSETDAHDHGVEDPTDHIAFIYEEQSDQLSTVVPFLRRGLEQGERCLYLADDNTIEEVADALREAGVDVAQARDSGALTFHTKEDTYLRTGEFDREAMVEFWKTSLARARDQEGFDGIRAAAEMTWALDSETDFDALLRYETLLNGLYADDDYTVLCQYNRDRFPPAVISDVVRAHPQVVRSTTVQGNPQYSPPDDHHDSGDPQQVSGVVGAGTDIQPADPATSTTALNTAPEPVRVLYVDDTPGYAETAATFLERDEELDTVVTETNPHDAIDRLDDESIDCVVSDYDMPEVNGLELLGLIREKHQDIPFVLVTGQGDEEVASEAISAGVTDYFRKQQGFEQYAVLANRITNAVEQRRRERETRQTRRQYRRLVESSTDVITVLDEAGRFRYVSPAAERRLGYPAEELVGESGFERVHRDDRETVAEEFRTLVEQPDGSTVTEFRFLQPDGTWIWLEARWRNRLDDSDIGGVVMYARDVTERKEREQTLTALHDSSRDLLGAESDTEVAECIVKAGTELLSMSTVAVYLFEAAEGRLKPSAVSRNTIDANALEAIVPDQDSIVGSAFLENEPRRIDAPGDADAVPKLPLRSGLLFPLGDHGVCVIGDAESAVTDDDKELAEILTATAETALDRVTTERELREQQTELRTQNQQLERLNEVNATIREIDQAVARADTREEIETAVCDHLSTCSGVASVWISEQDSGRLVPREWDGVDGTSRYIDTVSLSIDDESKTPATQVARTSETVHVANIADDVHQDTWRKTALSHGYRSVLSIPLTYKHISYGTVSVYTEEADILDTVSRSVFKDLSNKVANSLNAVEHQNAVLAESMTEVKFQLTDENLPLNHVAARADCSLTLETITQSSETVTKYLRVEGADPTTVTDTAEELTAIAEASVVTDNGQESLLAVQYSGKPLAVTLADRGVRVPEFDVDAGSARITLLVPDTVDTEWILEKFETRDLQPELVAKTEQTRSDSVPRQHTVDAFRSKLTPRQQEVLRTAYLSGFFQSPRECTGEELADYLDVSPQTVYGHIRTAERKLFEAVFGDGVNSHPLRS